MISQLTKILLVLALVSSGMGAATYFLIGHQEGEFSTEKAQVDLEQDSLNLREMGYTKEEGYLNYCDTPCRIREYLETVDGEVETGARDFYDISDSKTFYVGEQSPGNKLQVASMEVNETYWYIFVSGTIDAGYLTTIRNGIDQIFLDQSDPGNELFRAPPDADLNFQVVVLITPIDGVGNIAGYFDPRDPEQDPNSNVDSIPNPIDMIYVDLDDISDGQDALHVIAHEYQHLLQYAHDKDEFLAGEFWQLEGMANYAVGVTYNGPTTPIVASHLAWFENNPDWPFLFWDSNVIDYGYATYFMYYLQARFGNTQDDFIGALFDDQGADYNIPDDAANGTVSVEDVAGRPEFGNDPGLTFDEIFQDFLVALTIDDSAKSRYGFGSPSVLGFTPNIFKDPLDTWIDYPVPVVQRTVKSWGLDIITFNNGTGAPLDIHFNGQSPDRNFAAQVVKWDGVTSDVTQLSLDSSEEVYHTVSDFDATDTVYLIVTYLDPDGEDPVAGNDTMTYYYDAVRVDTPPSLRINNTDFSLDLDNDTFPDTARIDLEIDSVALAEQVTIIVETLDELNDIIDVTTRDLTVTYSSNNSQPVFFTAKYNDNYSFRVSLIDAADVQQTEVMTGEFGLLNLKPTNADAMANATFVQTWDKIILGTSIRDDWGTYWDVAYNYSYSDDMAVYDWSLGDGNKSFLKTPLIRYPFVGNYTIDLAVFDAGGGICVCTGA